MKQSKMKNWNQSIFKMQKVTRKIPIHLMVWKAAKVRWIKKQLVDRTRKEIWVINLWSTIFFMQEHLRHHLIIAKLKSNHHATYKIKPCKYHKWMCLTIHSYLVLVPKVRAWKGPTLRLLSKLMKWYHRQRFKQIS